MNFICITIISCAIAKAYDLTRGKNKIMRSEQSSQNQVKILMLLKKLLS